MIKVRGTTRGASRSTAADRAPIDDTLHQDRACFLRRACERKWPLIEVHAIGEPGTKGDGKQPVGNGWQTRGAVPFERALSWLRAGRNVGLLPGKAGAAVLDVEPKGLGIWPRSRIPVGALAISSAAGDVGAYHLYFGLAAVERVLGRELRKEKLEGKAELFGRRGQVLVPGSRAITEKGGPRREGTYEVLQNGEPISDEAVIREWLAPFIEHARANRATKSSQFEDRDWSPACGTTAYGRAALEGASAAIAAAPQGSRQNTFLAEAAGIFELVAGGELEAPEAEAGLRAAYVAGLPDEVNDLERRMAWARERGSTNPRRAPGREPARDAARSTPTSRAVPPGEPSPPQGASTAHDQSGPSEGSVPPPKQKPPASASEIRWYAPDDLPERTPDDDIVRDFLAPGELACLAATSTAGKTFIGLDLAVAVAGDREHFLTQRVQKHGVVLYMVGEGFRGLRARVKAADPKGRASARLRFADHVPTLLDLDSVKATLHAVRGVIAEQMHGEMPLLIVIDTFAHATAGQNENDNGAMAAAARAAQSFARETGAAVLLVHHAKKNRGQDESFLRGASSLLCALDAAWGVERVAGSEFERIVTCEKQKDRPSDGVWRVTFAPVNVGRCTTLRIDKVERIASAAKEHMRMKKNAAVRVLRRDAILCELMEHEKGLRSAALLDRLVRRGFSLSDRTLRNQLNELRAAQLVDHAGEGKAGRHFLTHRGRVVAVNELRQADKVPGVPAPRVADDESTAGHAGKANPEGCRVRDVGDGVADVGAGSEPGKDSGKRAKRNRPSRSQRGGSGKRTRKATRKRKRQRAATRQQAHPSRGGLPLPGSLPQPVEEARSQAGVAGSGKAMRTNAELFPRRAVRDPEASGSAGGP